VVQQGLLILRKARSHILLWLLIAVSLSISLAQYQAPQALGAQLTSRSLQVSDELAGRHNVTYNIAFTVATGGTVGSMEFQFCSNSALIVDPCVAPFGFDALNANLASQSGTNGFIMSGSSSVNDIVLTQAPLGTVNPGPVSFTFTSVVNPTDMGSYYVKVFTYSSSDASGSPLDFGAMAFPIGLDYQISTEVPPYLTFCAGTNIDGFDCSTAAGDQINFGDFSSAVSSAARSQLLTATNAGSGYSITASGLTMTSGNNEIPAMSTNQASTIGKSQFGLNLRANTVPQIGSNPVGPGTGTPTANYNQVNRFRFVNGETIAHATEAQDYKKYTISYLVNISKDQAPGVYSTTLTYVCLANF
jgi:hypothetical protein